MHNTANGVFTDNAIDHLGVADITYDKRSVGDGLTESGSQIIQNDHSLAPSAQLLHYVASDITGTTRNQYRPLTRHVRTSSI
jgi:hypothetical protein